MDKIMEKLNKLSLPAVILIASLVLGGFFYASQVNKQRSIERQQEIKLQDDKQQQEIKIEQEKQDQLAKELKEQQAKEEAEQALKVCIATANSSYSDQWHEECKARGKLTNRCISIKEMTFSEYSDKNPPKEDLLQKGLDSPELQEFLNKQVIDFSKERNECSCGLPLAIGDRINDRLEKDEADCYKRYPQ